jgi:hypothetical protein
VSNKQDPELRSNTHSPAVQIRRKQKSVIRRNGKSYKKGGGIESEGSEGRKGVVKRKMNGRVSGRKKEGAR